MKNLKGKFTPKFIQMGGNRKGRLVSLKERSEAIADYLEKEHWSNPAETSAGRHIDTGKICSQANKENQKAPSAWENLRRH